MNLFCWQHRRELSRAAALQNDIEDDPVLKQHLCRCEACREYWSDLCSLTGALMHASTPKASPMFIGNLHSRLVPPTSRSIDWKQAFVPALAVGVLVLGLTAWRVLSPRAQPNSIVFSDPPKSNDPPVQAYQPVFHEKRVTIVPLIRPNLRRRALVKDESTGRSRLHFARANTRNEELPDPPAISRSEDARRWRECGLLLEAGGEARLAQTAYRASYMRRPTMQTAYDLGRSAEVTGDPDQALDIYADVLSSTDARPDSQKGNNP